MFCNIVPWYLTFVWHLEDKTAVDKHVTGSVRPPPPPVFAFICIAQRVQGSHCSSILIEFGTAGTSYRSHLAVRAAVFEPKKGISLPVELLKRGVIIG